MIDFANRPKGFHMRHLLTVLVLGGLAWAAPPDVPQSLTAKPGQLVRVTVKTDAEIGVLRNFTDEQAFFEELSARKGERRFVFQAPDDAKPGTVFVVGWWSKGETEGAATTITVAGKVPPIVDPVKPDPVKPEPANKAEKVAVVVVEESAQRTVKQAEQLASLRKWADAGGHTLFVVDKDDAAVQKNGYAPHVSRAGVPCVLVFDQKGSDKPLSVFKMDADPVAKVKEVVK